MSLLQLRTQQEQQQDTAAGLTDGILKLQWCIILAAWCFCFAAGAAYMLSALRLTA
jgi:hypothetical protein